MDIEDLKNTTKEVFIEAYGEGEDGKATERLDEYLTATGSIIKLADEDVVEQKLPEAARILIRYALDPEKTIDQLIECLCEHFHIKTN